MSTLGGSDFLLGGQGPGLGVQVLFYSHVALPHSESDSRVTCHGPHAQADGHRHTHTPHYTLKSHASTALLRSSAVEPYSVSCLCASRSTVLATAISTHSLLMYLTCDQAERAARVGVRASGAGRRARADASTASGERGRRAGGDVARAPGTWTRPWTPRQHRASRAPRCRPCARRAYSCGKV